MNTLEDFICQNGSLLASMPDCLNIYDENSRVAFSNDIATKYMGFSSPEDTIGNIYHDQRCKASESHEAFLKQDKLVFDSKETQEFLTLDSFGDGLELVRCVKRPLFNNKNDVVGILSPIQSLSKSGIVDLSTFLFDSVQGFRGSIRKSFTFNIVGSIYANKYDITPQQLECLFYYIRGKTAKEIAMMVHKVKNEEENISYRTAQRNLSEVKAKFGCSTRSQLIEKAYLEGYFSMIPRSILNNVNKLLLK